ARSPAQPGRRGCALQNGGASVGMNTIGVEMATTYELTTAQMQPRQFELDTLREIEQISLALQIGIGQTLHRRGAVVGCSGGIDSSVVLALAVRALGAGRVLAVLMPERESDPDSARLAHELAAGLGVKVVEEDL